MGTVVVVLVLVALAGACLYAARRAHERRKMFNALPPAEQQRSLQIREADKAVKSATKDYNRRVKDARRALDDARTPKKLAKFKTAHVGSFSDAFKGDRDFVLWDDRIKTPSGEHPLTPNVCASVDTAGNIMHKSRSTLTRMGAGTVIAGPIGLLVGVAAKKGKTVDNRELYLFVEGDDWADSTNCDPDKEGQRVREFAQKVNLAARTVEAVKAERARSVEELTQRLEAAERDRNAIELAERARAALGDDPMIRPEVPEATTVADRA